MVSDYTPIKELSDSIFLCKALWGHDWDQNPSPQYIDGEVARLSYRMLCLRCTRCYRERYDYINRSGGLIGRYYKNPVNYPKTHRMGGDELRAEMIRRSLMVINYRNGKK